MRILFQYLRLARELDHYGEIVFPHCGCDSRKGGHVIAIIGEQCLKLQACKEDGTPEVWYIEQMVFVVIIVNMIQIVVNLG